MRRHASHNSRRFSACTHVARRETPRGRRALARPLARESHVVRPPSGELTTKQCLYVPSFRVSKGVDECVLSDRCSCRTDTPSARATTQSTQMLGLTSAGKARVMLLGTA
jgi:hypothetical protein